MYHYIHLKILPPTSDALIIRKIIADALSQTFGLSTEGTYVDILSLSEGGGTCVLRVQQKCAYSLHASVVSVSDTPGSDAPKIITSLATWTGNCQFSLIRESPFLPSLLAEPLV